ncbi:MAG: ABC transporter ATP-binding protein [Candidatus Cloacimonadaceae bacterium]|jgi:lipoprotein-releasing system ATP-binding protein|nr:ABC transporter ATP-binding protein [Candidatus Cloacimonadota bacterium]MDY0380860.1 ABC transporter ATP-binding protein [Candidatus Cloacimonadaceae bacterium]HCM15889.1 lipoprotein-releasing system ATP-binding protein LolD [Candidatus Cloacimonas sp.]MCK9433468.1 ABC transporter ATP-binding protein [Candidatus Cloacimonadota bacterium]MDD4233190.1 ABC transporter ATP-binding protein [Candidatus Cloacimonadota bacterium]
MILSAKHLTKTYIDSDQTIEVLKDASLDISAGELVCITGKSGCGKSTMLHIMGLLDEPDSGELEICSKLIHSNDPSAPEVRNRDLGFVFQFHYLIEDLSAIENVALPLLIAGNSESGARKRAKELLVLLGLQDRLNRYPNQLSGGEQQRVSLARALANEPKLVLADEPTGNLDPTHSNEVWEMIRKLNRELNQAFVVVTHDVEAAVKATRSFELLDGRLIQLEA